MTRTIGGGDVVESPRVGRIVVGVSGSLGNLAAVHAAAGEARLHAGMLVAVLAWHPPGGELTYRRAPCAQLLQVWREQATETLQTALADAFGGSPHDVVLEPVVVRGDAGPVLVALARWPGDLLVVGTGRRGHLTRLCHGAVSRYCLAHARCPVLAVPPPELISEVRHGRIRVRERDIARAGLLSRTATIKRR
jgi:nucleotide-binding universal stress UspA family protein